MTWDEADKQWAEDVAAMAMLIMIVGVCLLISNYGLFSR